MAFLKVPDIPDADNVFCRVHKNHYDREKKRILSPAFSKVEQSVNWARRTTASSTAAPSSVFVVSFNVGWVKGIGQQVIHDPLEEGELGGPNEDHSLIVGDKSIAKDQLRDEAMNSIVWTNSEFL